MSIRALLRRICSVVYIYVCSIRFSAQFLADDITNTSAHLLFLSLVVSKQGLHLVWICGEPGWTKNDLYYRPLLQITLRTFAAAWC